MTSAQLRALALAEKKVRSVQSKKEAQEQNRSQQEASKAAREEGKAAKELQRRVLAKAKRAASARKAEEDKARKVLNHLSPCLVTLKGALARLELLPNQGENEEALLRAESLKALLKRCDFYLVAAETFTSDRDALVFQFRAQDAMSLKKEVEQCVAKASPK